MAEAFGDYLKSLQQLEELRSRKHQRGDSSDRKLKTKKSTFELGNPNYLKWTHNFERKSTLWNDGKNQLENPPVYLN